MRSHALPRLPSTALKFSVFLPCRSPACCKTLVRPWPNSAIKRSASAHQEWECRSVLPGHTREAPNHRWSSSAAAKVFPCPTSHPCLCSPASCSLQLRPRGGFPGPSPHQCPSQCHSRAIKLLLVHLVGASAGRQWAAGPAHHSHCSSPLGAAEVCFSARRSAQICCQPRGGWEKMVKEWSHST